MRVSKKSLVSFKILVFESAVIQICGTVNVCLSCTPWMERTPDSFSHVCFLSLVGLLRRISRLGFLKYILCVVQDYFSRFDLHTPTTSSSNGVWIIQTYIVCMFSLPMHRFYIF